jgi:Uma2 family endonuclease
MGTMTSLPAVGGLTRADLDAMPDDGRRYELIDGAIVVSPAPSARHQDVVISLVVLLLAARTPDVKVMVAPFDVALADDTVIQPDVVVARRGDVTEKELPAAPLLAVEVLSPSTRRVDRTLKKEILAESGCPSYWIVDPGRGPTPPSLVAYELHQGAYVEVARVSGAESWTASRPFPVTVIPVDLLDD